MAQTREFRGVARSKHTDTFGNTHFAYHGTTVLTVAKDNTLIFNSGGWRTATTKLAMNQAISESGFSHVGVFQKKGDWFVQIGSDTIPFFDGMSVHV